ncbi:MAG TPA: serine hydrolase domain-containing protein [Gemmatimonadaceae bacterium]|nr:serine hydrolase domain-containing protein [Gemmatimonadaceae bacterium]
MRPTAFLLAAALSAAAPDSAATRTPPQPPPATIAELTARIQKVLDSTHTPGMGLAIVSRDSVLYTGGVGLARVAPAMKATDSTLFRIGSTSKAFVALTALALEREGKLSLQDPVRKHLPGFYYRNPWDATDPVRIVDLLEHTSGFDDNSLMGYAIDDPALSLADALARDSATRVSRWRPGTRFSYCNTGPAIVALIIEKIEGKPFEQVIQERWFTPLGMATATYFHPDTTKVAAATLYRPDGRTPVPYWNVFIRPAGAINASAHDMAAYVRFLLDRGAVRGAQLLPPSSIERMERSETWIGARHGLTVGYGLHLYRIADSTGFVWVSHNGGVDGGISDMSYLPEQGVGYAYQINTGNPAAVLEITRLVRAYLTRGLPRGASPARAAIPAGIRREFSGWYESVSPRVQHLYFLDRLTTLTHVSVGDSTLRIAPLFAPAAVFHAQDSMRSFRDGAAMSSIVMLHDAENGRPEGIETFGAALGGSLARLPTWLALVEIVLAGAWAVGFLFTFLAALTGGLRRLVRRLRSLPAPAIPSAPLWRVALLSAALLCVNLVGISIGSDDVRTLGNLTALSGTVYAAGLLFAIVSVGAVVIVFRRRATASRWQWFSLLAAREVLLLNAIAALYMLYWGFIGWRTWV